MQTENTGKYDYQAIWQRLLNWIEENEYKSFDVSDTLSTKLYLTLLWFYKRYRIGKYVYFPFYKLNQLFPKQIRSIAGVSKQEFPQAYAIIVKALLNIFRKSNDTWHLDKAINLSDKLFKIKNTDFQYNCWGQPFDWYTRKLIPKYTPRTTVTSQVASAFLDMYEVTKQEKYLLEAKSAAKFFIHEMNYFTDKEGDICFPYTAIDDYKVHNANTLAAAVLYRVYNHTGEDIFKDFSIRSFQFTVKHQTPEGAWYYWAPPDKLLYRIDNYHTGFVLESLLEAKECMQTNFRFETALKDGLNYYIENLFAENRIPKMTNKKTYPIDIQSCAQSLITFSKADKFYPSNSNRIKKITEWTMNNMFDHEKNYFYYRKYKSGRTDKTPYIRWSESWMLHALSFLIK